MTQRDNFFIYLVTGLLKESKNLGAWKNKCVNVINNVTELCPLVILKLN